MQDVSFDDATRSRITKKPVGRIGRGRGRGIVGGGSKSNSRGRKSGVVKKKPARRA